MDVRSIEILKVLLETSKPLHNSEISKRAWNRSGGKKKLGVDKASWKVICSKKLRALTEQGFLRRNDLGHKDVRYSFKNQKMREKAKLTVFTETDELKNVLLDIVDAEKKLGSEKIVGKSNSVDFVFGAACMASMVIPLSYTPLFLQAIKDGHPEDLAFYRERELATLNAYRECLIELIKGQNIDRLIELANAVVENFHIDPASMLTVEGMTKFFKRKFETTYVKRAKKLR